MTSITSRSLASLVSLVLITACTQSGSLAVRESTPAQATGPSLYETAVASDARPQADRDRDAGRRPAEILAFMGIESGMTVLDMFTGGGYYAEIISGVVGSDGKVIAQANKAYLNFVGEEFEARFGSGHLTNTEVLMAENNEMSLQADSIDAVMMALNYHDLYHEDLDIGWAAFDVPAFLAELRKGVKPGGIVCIIDHYAEAGAAAESGDTLHRIDPAIVVADMEAAGFTREASSDLLRNPDDDLSKIVFAEGIRGKTDRFVIRFRNPK